MLSQKLLPFRSSQDDIYRNLSGDGAYHQHYHDHRDVSYACLEDKSNILANYLANSQLNNASKSALEYLYQKLYLTSINVSIINIETKQMTSTLQLSRSNLGKVFY